MTTRIRRAVIVAAILAVGGGVAVSLRPRAKPPAGPPSFARDIKPVLADRCFACHGPDADSRQAGLRLDDPAAAAKHAPEIARRVESSDPDVRMPPPDAGPELTTDQIAHLRHWAGTGAVLEPHWAFVPPRRDASESIDALITDRLHREGLEMSPPADKATLLRRVTLDLTGLPPTVVEVDAFLADASTDAYEKVIDRLLRSPRFGEHMAWRWLEVARFADTNGYQNDHERQMWRWRDWVIGAYNRNLPYDAFLTEQLAGDLLPDATTRQVVATGFNRNHRMNSEFGADQKEFAVEYVVDRVETASTAFMGLTVGCARCHDHKFDPVTQREFYQMFAMFGNVPEKGQARNEGNSPPVVRSPTPEQAAELRQAGAAVRAADQRWEKLSADAERAQRKWETALPFPQEWRNWWPSRALSHAISFEEPTPPVTVPNGGVFQSTGRVGNGASLKDDGFMDAGPVGDFSHADRFTLAMWFYAADAANGVLISKGQDVAGEPGYFVELDKGKLRATLARLPGADGLAVETESEYASKRWHHVAVTYDGSRSAEGLRVFVDGQLAPTRVLLDECYYSFQAAQPLRLGAGGGRPRFAGFLDELRLYADVLAPDEVLALSSPETIDAILAMPPEKRPIAAAAKLRLYFLEDHAPASIRSARLATFNTRRHYRKTLERTTTTMVMAERDGEPKAAVLRRGQFDSPGEEVTPGVPAALPPWPKDAPRNRLGFARWLTDPSHPLTARVAVNRAWQMHFGAGLVRTAEDFGAQGEPPTHPELLDELAAGFVAGAPLGGGSRDSGGGGSRPWDVKALHRRIVTSATYRQSSRVTPALQSRDPENRFLARAPRLRLPAPVVRDQALAASGLLVEKVGGPSVRPYQPPGLWSELTGQADYASDTGDGRHRRSLYTFWKRTAPAPGMMTFDASPREACAVREPRTNTPLQALAMMNEWTYVEASRALADRVQGDDDQRLRQMFALVLSRSPDEREMGVLREALAAQRAIAPESAFTVVANLVLNLDEAITRE